jgi:hypothetical protein
MKPRVAILSGAILTAAAAQAIVCPADAPAQVKLAAKEIRRYIYLRTGNLPLIAESGGGYVLKVDPALEPQAYRLTAGVSLTWPAAAPQLNQAVVIMPTLE